MAHSKPATMNIENGGRIGPAKDTKMTNPEAVDLEAIAIVGMSMGFPQDVDSPEILWQTIMEKRSTATKFPSARMTVDSMYHPDPNRRGQISMERGHFLNRNLAEFDAPFFAISASDASSMDPQQRLLMEHTYLALENAGIPFEKVSGSKTSVYTGSFCNDWQHLTFRDGEECSLTSAMGATSNFNANRLSWFFNLHGNSTNIDTACSSSLVCLDLACQGLRSGTEDMGIVTGSNVMLAPDIMHSLTNMNMLSPHGECYSFDHRGNGYSRGEGVGVLILKRVTDAIRDGDTIRGIIRNSGCNQDGRTTSITLPSASLQAELITQCYNKAGLSMAPVRFLEAHGTGTPVGDPIEANSIGSVFRHVRTSDDPLWLGAVKANIGHLEGASGIAGVIKAVLVLEKAIIPPNNNFEKINSKIDLDFLHLQIPTEAIPWPTSGLRRTSVNSFGNGGTNAHVILDDVYHYLADRGLSANHITVRDPPLLSQLSAGLCNASGKQSNANEALTAEAKLIPRLLVLSAADEAGIRRQAKKLASYFAHVKTPQSQQTYLNNVAHTLDTRRSLFAWRATAVAGSIGDLTRLDTLISNARFAMSTPGIGFVFTGQGAQWAGMGRELLSIPSFRGTLLRLQIFLTTLGCPWELLHELTSADQVRLDEPSFAQPLSTAIQIALVGLLRTCGIEPTCVIGHSSGEIAAAYCIGALTEDCAMKVAYYRGKLASQLIEAQTTKTSMMYVGLSETEASPYLLQMNASLQTPLKSLVIGCVNSPSSVTLSGDEEQLRILQDLLQSKGIFCRKLAVNIAYHSPYMQAIAKTYQELITPLEKGHAPRHPALMFSSVDGHGEQAHLEDLTNSEYWVSNMVSTVKFASALSALCARRARRVAKKIDSSHKNLISIDMFIEIGPHAALQNPVKSTLESLPGSADITYASCLARNVNAIDTVLRAVGQAFSLGHEIDFAMVNSIENDSRNHVLSDLPGYAFDFSKKYWTESRISAQNRNNLQPKLDLLGKPVNDWNALEPRWRNRLRISEMPWIEEHVVNGALIYPGAGMLVMAIEAMRQMVDKLRPLEGIEIGQAHFIRSLPITQDPDGIETQVSLRMTDATTASGSPWYEFCVYAFEEHSWHARCKGLVRPRYSDTDNRVDQGRAVMQHLAALNLKMDTFEKLCKIPMNADVLYDSYHKNNGIALGPSFHRIQHGHIDKEAHVVAELELFQWSDEDHPQKHVIHPTTLDAVFQAATAGYSEGGNRNIDTMIPTYLDYLYVSQEGLMSQDCERVTECAWLANLTKRAARYSGFVLNKARSKLLVEFDDVRLTSIAKAKDADQSEYNQNDPLVFEIVHTPDLARLNPAELRSLCQRSSTPSLFQWMDLLYHKDTRLEIFDVGTENQHFNKALLSHLSTFDDEGQIMMSRYHAYHYASTSQDSMHKMESSLAEFPRVQFSSKDIAEASKDTENGDMYDVIFAPMHTGANVSALHNIKGMLKPGGKVAFVRGLHDGMNETAHNEVLSTVATSGFTDQNINLRWEDTECIICTIESVQEDPIIALVTVVHDFSTAAQLKFFDTISSVMSSKNIPCRGLRLSEVGRTAAPGEIFVVALEIHSPFLYELSEESFYSMKSFLLAANDIVWVNYSGGSTSPKPEFSMIHGLSRVLQHEKPESKMTVLSLDCRDQLSSKQAATILQVAGEHSLTRSNKQETEYFERDGLLSIPRIKLSNPVNNDIIAQSQQKTRKNGLVKDMPPVKLSVGSVGLIETLGLEADSLVRQPLSADEIEVEVKAVGLNYTDCLVALGKSSSNALGHECAGTVTRAGLESGFSTGDRVLLFAPNVFRSIAYGTKTQALRIPASMSYVTAAAIPVQYGTAWEVVKRLGRLEQGDSILIHAAAGGTGQAAIQLCKAMGIEIFATVGSTSKKQLLTDLYGLSADHIFYSRDTSFARQVKQITHGNGVDVILNSLSGDAGLASWDCIAPYGRIIDISKRDKPVSIPLRDSVKNVSYITFDWVQMLADKPAALLKSVRSIFEEIESGALPPPSVVQTYDISEVIEAFKILSSGTSVGKVVIELNAASWIDVALDNRPMTKLTSDGTYLIAGGLGGLGRASARWLVERGARNLLLLSRSGPRTADTVAFLDGLRAQGVSVQTPACDVRDYNRLQSVLQDALTGMPPIKGCIQGTMVRRDCLLEDMSFDDWDLAVNCKTKGTWNLHSLLPADMDFFILLSSASGLSGVRGQINYNVGNTYEDAFAHYRGETLGQRTISLDLAAMRDDGLLAEDPELMRRALGYGVLKPVSRSIFHSLLDRYCNTGDAGRDKNTVQPTSIAKERQIAVGLGMGSSDSLESMDYSHHPMMYPLQVLGEQLRPSGGEENTVMDYRKLFMESKSLDEGADTIAKAIAAKLATSLAAMGNGDTVDLNRPLQVYGVDSLLAIDLRNWLAKEFVTELAVFETQGMSTIATLSFLVAKRSTLLHLSS